MGLFATPMPVVTLASLVVITEYTHLVDDISQPVFEGVPGPRQRPRKPPDNKLCKLVLGIDDALAEEFGGLHVGDDANIQTVLSTTPTPCDDLNL